jgi:hypothetical protein
MIIAVFWDVFCRHGNLVVTFHQIDFGKNHVTMQAIWKVFHVWQWILVGSCYQVEMAVVAARPSRPIFFRHHGVTTTQSKRTWLVSGAMVIVNFHK